MQSSKLLSLKNQMFPSVKRIISFIFETLLIDEKYEISNVVKLAKFRG